MFICHSLGGLIVKQLLLEADRRAQSNDKDTIALIKRVMSVIFIATPHTGSYQASTLVRLRFLVWPSEATQNLVANYSSLRKLHQSYIQWPRAENMKNLDVQEGIDTFGFRIVPPAVTWLNTNPFFVDKNHIDSCKLEDREDPPYRQVLRLVRDFCSNRRDCDPQNDNKLVLSIEPLRKLKRDSAFVPVRIARDSMIVVLAAGLGLLLPSEREFVS